MSMGIQSGNEKIRTKMLHRKHTDELIIAAAQRIKKHGLKLQAEYIFQPCFIFFAKVSILIGSPISRTKISPPRAIALA